MFRTILGFMVLVFLAYHVDAQDFTKDYKPSAKFAEYCLKFGNYTDGLREYKLLLQESPKRSSYHLGLAICYAHLNGDKEQAVKQLEWVLRQKNAPPRAWYYLGWVSLQLGRFDEAEQALKQYRALGFDKGDGLPASRLIEMVQAAREAYQRPEDVELVNVGKLVNTPNAEYSPFIPANESVVIFNSDRKSNLGNFRFYDGKYPSDIYFAAYKFGRWKKARRMSVVNTSDIDRIVGLTPDGALLFMIREDVDGHRSLWYARKRGKYYRQPKPLLISGVDASSISSLCLSPDRRFLVFAAQGIPHGKHDKDLFVSRILPSGEWSEPELLDSSINSPYHEDYPSFSPDGRYFFFASQGHNSMGGYDLFKAAYTVDSLFHFAKPQNLGYPVNTTGDDMSISLSRSGRYGYLASYRPGAYGDLDIYRVIFHQVQARFTVVTGTILDADSLPFTREIARLNQHIDTLNFPVNREYKRLLIKKKDSAAAYAVLATRKAYEQVDVRVEAINKKTGKSFGHFRARNDNAHYTVILPPGEWTLRFTRPGYHSALLSPVFIEERDQRRRLVYRNIKMIKKDNEQQ